MAWSSLASNQMVSFTDAQSSGYELNPGQSHVTSNQCMTKNDALTKYKLNQRYMTGWSSNQLAQKGSWSPYVPITQDLDNYTNPCGMVITNLWYDDNYDLYYTSSAATTLYNGTGNIYYGPDPSSGYIWMEYSYVNGVKTFVRYRNSPCSI